MNRRIDVYFKNSKGRWEYLECTRNFVTLAAAERWHAKFYGGPIKCKWGD